MPRGAHRHWDDLLLLLSADSHEMISSEVFITVSVLDLFHMDGRMIRLVECAVSQVKDGAVLIYEVKCHWRGGLIMDHDGSEHANDKATQ